MGRSKSVGGQFCPRRTFVTGSVTRSRPNTVLEQCRKAACERILRSMHELMNPNSVLKTGSRCPDRQHFFTQIILLFCLALRITSSASENVPHRPFAQWADVPERGQFVFGMVYQESEAYRIWAGRDFHDITVKS